jgi:hypothetical protein
LPLVTAAYNTSSHATLGQSPHAAMLGFEPFPIVPIAEPTSFAEWTSLSKFGGEVREAILATDKIIEDLDRQTPAHDVFKTGDLVMVKVHSVGKGLSRKLLLQRWVGPYKVISSTGALEKSLLLASEEIEGKRIRASYRNVKRYVPRLIPQDFNLNKSNGEATQIPSIGQTSTVKRQASPLSVDEHHIATTSRGDAREDVGSSDIQCTTPTCPAPPDTVNDELLPTVKRSTVGTSLTTTHSSVPCMTTTTRNSKYGRSINRPSYLSDFVNAPISTITRAFGFSDDESDAEAVSE